MKMESCELCLSVSASDLENKRVSVKKWLVYLFPHTSFSATTLSHSFTFALFITHSQTASIHRDHSAIYYFQQSSQQL